MNVNMRRLRKSGSCVALFKVIACALQVFCALRASLVCMVLPVQAQDLPQKLDRSETVVFLENITNLSTLIGAEANWISANFPNCELISFSCEVKRLNVITNKLLVEAKNRDLAIIKVQGESTNVTFYYDEIPVEKSMPSLWSGYMPYLMTTNSQRIASAQLGRFVSTVKRMDISLVLPYLIKQLDDDRMIKIHLVSDGTRACDLVIFSFLSELEYSQSGKLVFPHFQSDSAWLVFRKRTVVDAGFMQVKRWWNSEDER